MFLKSSPKKALQVAQRSNHRDSSLKTQSLLKCLITCQVVKSLKISLNIIKHSKREL